MTLSVHLLRERNAEALSHLRERLHPDVQITVGPELPQPTAYEILVAGRPEREHLVASPNLRALIIPWSGLPESTREVLLQYPGIAVHNLHHNALPVAEMALTLLLAAAKFIIPIDRALRQHDWRPRYRPNPSILLEGKTALILGYGAIGHHIARMCQGFGVEIWAIRRSVSEKVKEGSVTLHPPNVLHDLLPQVDALLVCLPHTPETEGLVGAEELALLPSSAVLVNVGRGPVVDQEALYRALRDGGLYAAGLDVWYNYPDDEAARAHTPPASYPFHELDNVVMSPHRAGGSRETEYRRMERLAVLLNAAARGESMPNRVDLKRGY